MTDGIEKPKPKRAPRPKFPIRHMRTGFGERVSAYHSSLATKKCMWLAINTAENKNDLDGGKRVEATATLTVAQAKRLRDALTAFIDGP